MKISIRYDRSILQSAIAAYIRRVYLRHLLWPSLLALGLLAGSLYLGQSPWLQAFIVVVVLLVPSALILGYWMRIRHSLKILGLLDDGKIDITISDDGVTTESAIGRSQLKWVMFSELWDTPRAKLLIYTNNQFVTLPKAQVPEHVFDEISKYLKSTRGNEHGSH